VRRKWLLNQSVAETVVAPGLFYSARQPIHLLHFARFSFALSLVGASLLVIAICQLLSVDCAAAIASRLAPTGI